MTIQSARLMLGGLAVLLGSCSPRGQDDIITIDGSSTVFPILEALAEEFSREHQGLITIGVSGTGGGFKKLCAREKDLIGASRPISAGELRRCAARGIEVVELPIAMDGIVVAAHPKNTWASQIDVQELQRLWRPEAQGQVMRWSQVRPQWPDRPIRLYGPGLDSGTYDYFTQAIVGEAHSSRGDFTSSEDDHTLITGVSRDEAALGFFGFAYYREHQDKLRALSVSAAPQRGAVAPTRQSIAQGTYWPLSRPLFVYVARHALERPQVRDFLSYALTRGQPFIEEVGYVPLPETIQALTRARLTSGQIGSVFMNAPPGQAMDQVLGSTTSDE